MEERETDRQTDRQRGRDRKIKCQTTKGCEEGRQLFKIQKRSQ